MNGYRKYYIYTQTHIYRNIIQILKERQSYHLQQHGESGGNYAKRNKPDREKQIQFELTYMWNLKEPNS